MFSLKEFQISKLDYENTVLSYYLFEMNCLLNQKIVKNEKEIISDKKNENEIIIDDLTEEEKEIETKTLEMPEEIKTQEISETKSTKKRNLKRTFDDVHKREVINSPKESKQEDEELIIKLTPKKKRTTEKDSIEKSPEKVKRSLSPIIKSKKKLTDELLTTPKKRKRKQDKIIENASLVEPSPMKVQDYENQRVKKNFTFTSISKESKVPKLKKK
jgi:hypothetical protein